MHNACVCDLSCLQFIGLTFTMPLHALSVSTHLLVVVGVTGSIVTEGRTCNDNIIIVKIIRGIKPLPSTCTHTSVGEEGTPTPPQSGDSVSWLANYQSL